MVKNSITVFARLKPETSRKETVNYKIHRRPEKHSNDDFLVLTAPEKSFEYIDNRPESWNFSFHRIFSHDVSQNDVFESVARPIVDSVFDGYNGTIFAYGQTGSGKTYTITGDPGFEEERGILPRTLEYVFDVVRKNPENLYSVEVAYLEIYNENGYDLLLERKQREAATRLEDLPRVTIQEDESGTMHLKNFNLRLVENEKEALKYLAEGDSCRAIAETPMNPRSSRSHCLFTIVVSIKKFGSDRYRSAKMHLVDLAGSERVYKCAIQGTILTEAKHINLSLHFLEQVIVCLGQENISHVPYRNSLLTLILRDSLGGNCLTTMLANLSLSNFNLEETISTCRFAQRVALVRNDVNLTLDLDATSENKLLSLENARLRKEIEELKKQSIPDASGATIGPEYYKNLVIQRDKEISHLIHLLRKEKVRRESVNGETSEKFIDVISDEKSTQMPSSRVSTGKINQSSTEITKIERKHTNSPQGKSRTSPRRRTLVTPRSNREIQSQINESRFPEVPKLSLNDNCDEIKIINFSSLGIDLEASKNEDDKKIVTPKKQEIESDNQTPKARILRFNNLKNSGQEFTNNGGEKNSPKEQEIERDNQTPKAKIVSFNNLKNSGQEFTKNGGEKNSPKEQEIERENQTPKDRILSFNNLKNSGQEFTKNGGEKNSTKKQSSRDKSSEFPPNILKIMATPRKNDKEDEILRPNSESIDLRYTFKTSNSLSNILCVKKNSESESVVIGKRENSDTVKIDKNFEKSLPLTGDPEIDEEIIAFYRAKRGGGSY